VTVIVRDVTLHEVVCDLPRCPASLGTAKGFIEDVIAELDRTHPARSDLLLAIACIGRAVDAFDGGAA
jgi:hypothetical protein